MAHKTSEKSKKMSATNKINAAKKKHHHRTGSGGYLKTRPLWDKAEKDLLDKGVKPETLNWPDRARTWFFGIGEPWTLKQGSVFGRTSNWKYRSRSFGSISPQRRKGRSFPTERTMSSHRPSGILSTQDEHEARQAPFRGRLGFPAQAVTKPERGIGNMSSAICRS